MNDDTAAAALAALGNPTRLGLFRLLVRAGSAGLNTGDCVRHTGVPASTLAHHLMALARAGLIRQEKRGREVINAVDYAAIRDLTGFLTAECCVGVRLADDAA